MVSGAGPHATAAAWREIRLAVRSIVRLVVWSAILVGGLSAFYALAPYAGPVLRRMSRGESLQVFAAVVVMAFALMIIVSVARRKGPGRTGWIAVNGLVVAAGAATIAWLPGWSGILTAGAYGLFVIAPATLGARARRHASAGRLRSAAVALRTASWLHPSIAARFYAAFYAATARGAVEQKVAAYQALARTATPELAATLGPWIAFARDDWGGVLAQVRDVGPWAFAIRALGELGRIDEMIAVFAKRQSQLDRTSLMLCRLYVLAFCGRRDSVQALLNGRMRFLAADRKAYWAAIAAHAAGSEDGARAALARFARMSADETWRRAAERHLAEPARGSPVALSADAVKVIAQIEDKVARAPAGHP